MQAGSPLFGAIEAGGTKFVLAVGRSPTEVIARQVIPTRTPAETLGAALDWFRSQDPIAALGIATFGPARVDPAEPQWGTIAATPKPGWTDADLAGWFGRELAVPVGFDTDVNGAELGESRFGAGQGRSALAYVTVGTGIGGGLVVECRPVHGAAHPEMGHIFPRRHRLDQDFPGNCPVHGDCLEGLAAGPAILRRWGQSLSDLPRDHPAHAVIASYLGQLCHTIFALTAAEVVVMGGGVMQTPGLIAKVAEHAAQLDRGYLPGRSRQQVLPPGLGEHSGICGALILALEAAGG